jgi:hypothetical protein
VPGSDSGSSVTRIVKCLDKCAHSDVILVRARIGPAAKSSSSAPVNDTDDVEALTAWLEGSAA